MDKTVFTLKDRQIIHLLPFGPMRALGVALYNEEAQEYIAMGYDVHGDTQGPYLLVRLPRRMPMPWFYDRHGAEVTFSASPWGITYAAGVVCYLEKLV